MRGERDEAPLIVYGINGPAFERLCPSCGRFMKFPKTVKWSEDMYGICEFKKVKCSKCGPVEPNHVGWGSDFY